jgi:DNA mismatch repair protein MutL
VLYEQLNQRIAQGSLETQRLLLPESVAVTQQQMALIEEHSDLLERLGLEVSPFGRGSVAIHSSPTILNEVDLAAFLSDLLDALSEKGRKAEPENVLESMIQMMACKAAVKAGDRLTAAEIEALIEQRDVVEKSSNCPHGRPTTLRMTIADLEKQFKRV